MNNNLITSVGQLFFYYHIVTKSRDRDYRLFSCSNCPKYIVENPWNFVDSTV